MITPTAEQLQGVWENEDTAPFNHNKKYDFTFYIGHKILSLKNDTNEVNDVIADGDFEVVNFDGYRFKIKIENSQHTGLEYVICRMYMDKDPASFVATIPGYPDMYFVRK